MKLPRLHVVTDDAVLARVDFVGVARTILEAAGDRVALHVRGHATRTHQMYSLVEALAPTAAALGALLVVNDRVDVALAVEHTGAHLGARSLPLREARRLLGARRVIGYSAHGRDATERALAAGADYVFAGAVYATASHPERAPVGVEGLAACVAAGGAVPVLAIGGITAERLPAVLRAGAYGGAVLSAVWHADDPARETERLLVAIDSEMGR